MYKIILADDHPMTLMGTEAYLKSLKFNIVGAYANGISCLNGILTLHPDIAIIDVSMPGMNGLEILGIIKHKKLPIKIILQTMHKEISVFQRANEQDVDGYILKEDAQKDLKTCIQKVMSGGKYTSPNLEGFLLIDQNPKRTELLAKLSKQEVKIIELVAEFKTNKEIAEYLFIAEKTVETHKKNICHKLSLPKGKNLLLL